LGTGDTLLDADQDGLQLGSLRFQHVFTLSRGVTPAVISGVAVSAPWTFLSALESWGKSTKNVDDPNSSYLDPLFQANYGLVPLLVLVQTDD